MKEHVLVDITAAAEYANKVVTEMAKENANKHLDQYNSCHKRKIKDSSVEDMTTDFDGLAFGFSYYMNGYKDGNSGCFNIPIDEFIVQSTP